MLSNPGLKTGVKNYKTLLAKFRKIMQYLNINVMLKKSKK